MVGRYTSARAAGNRPARRATTVPARVVDGQRALDRLGALR
jgi:hypothetical protein